MKILRLSAYAAVAAPFILIGCDMIAISKEPGYNMWTQAISELSLGRGAYVQRIGFYFSCALLTLFTFGFYRRLPKGKSMTIATVLLYMAAFAFLMIGTFKENRLISDLNLTSTIHLVDAAIIFVAFPLAFFFFLPGFGADRNWRKLFKYSLVAGIIGIGLAITRATPVAEAVGRGFYERLMSYNIALWLEVMGIYSIVLNRKGETGG